MSWLDGHIFPQPLARGELVFDTAKRPELGTGKTVFKGTFIYARFLAGGDIFAPAMVQSLSLGGNSARAKVNNTVFDFCYMPDSLLARPRQTPRAGPPPRLWYETATLPNFAKVARIR